jgi:divalent metal cation (Fe/Co/Zn/Cd) transporter
VSEGHQLGEQASKSLIKHFSDITEVLVHIDPIQHETQERVTHVANNLPARAKVLKALHQSWHKLLDEEAIASVNLHYLGDSIEVDLVINVDAFSSALAEELQLAVQPISYISRLRIFNKLYESSIQATRS